MRNNTTPFDEVVEQWPGGEYISAQWRKGESYVVLADLGDGTHWTIEAARETFPSAKCERHIREVHILIAPKFAAEVCLWHAEEYGPLTCMLPVSDFGASAAGLDDDTLALLIARAVVDAEEWAAQCWADDLARLERVAQIAAVAGDAQAPLDLAFELATYEDDFDEEQFHAVLSTAINH